MNSKMHRDANHHDLSAAKLAIGYAILTSLAILANFIILIHRQAEQAPTTEATHYLQVRDKLLSVDNVKFNEPSRN